MSDEYLPKLWRYSEYSLEDDDVHPAGPNVSTDRNAMAALVRSISAAICEAERDAAASEAAAKAAKARLLNVMPSQLPPPAAAKAVRARIVLRGETRGSDSERSRFARGDDAMIAEMLAGGDAAARLRSEAGGPCSGVDFEEVENALTPQRVRDEARLPWLVVTLALALALLVASIAASLDLALSAIAEGKLDRVLSLSERSETAWPAFLALAGMNCVFVGFAGLCVGYLEPCAKGSGIPEIKAYLNGRRVPRVLHARTVVAKVAGVLGSVGGQLAVGKEGPLIHAGAGLGANLCAALAAAFRSSRAVGGLTTPAAVRDLVSIGCACGVAGAFAAPIGGVLFVLEEAASPQFWHSSLTSLTFLAASAAALAVCSLSSLHTEHEGMVAQASLVHFGAYEGASRPSWYDREEPWRIKELPTLCALGAVGGLAGALFIALNVRLTRWRMRNVCTRRARLAEVLLVSLVTSFCIFWAPSLAPCRPVSGLHFKLLQDAPMLAGPHCDLRSGAEPAEAEAELRNVNVLSSLLLHPLDHGVRILFHTTGALPALEVLCCGALLFVLACYAYGLAVPSGIFVPAIAVGACFGRAAGEFLVLAVGPNTTVDVGGMALVGAAAFLAGVTRVTLSAAVIVLETTSNMTYAPPVAIACLISKALGDLFGPGLYDAHLQLQRIAFLHDALPDSLRHLRAADVASSPVVCVSEVASARALLLALTGCKHNGFPVTYAHGPGRARKFSGMITRQQLIVILKHKAFMPERPAREEKGAQGQRSELNKALGPAERGAGTELSVNASIVFGDTTSSEAAHAYGDGFLHGSGGIGSSCADDGGNIGNGGGESSGDSRHAVRIGCDQSRLAADAQQPAPASSANGLSVSSGATALGTSPSAPQLSGARNGGGPHANAGLAIDGSGRWVRTASFAPNVSRATAQWFALHCAMSCFVRITHLNDTTLLVHLAPAWPRCAGAPPVPRLQGSRAPRALCG